MFFYISLQQRSFSNFWFVEKIKKKKEGGIQFKRELYFKFNQCPVKKLVFHHQWVFILYGLMLFKASIRLLT